MFNGHSLNFSSWICQSSCLSCWAMSRCKPKPNPLSQTSNKTLDANQNIWSHPTSQLILVTPWSQYLSMLNHIPASPLHPRIAMPWQKWISLDLCHCGVECVGNRNKLDLWSLSPLHLYNLQKGLDIRWCNEHFFPPALPLTKPESLHLIQYTSAEVP